MKSEINIFHVDREIALDDFADDAWRRAEKVSLTKLWSGADAPPERHAAARLLWTEAALWVRFDCEQHEPLIVSPTPNLEIEAEKLWERDVCELFISPDAGEPERYFEFEIAPTGEWLDFAVRQLPDRRETDTSFDSGMKTAAQIYENGWTAIFRVSWQALSKKPAAGDEWSGNLFRCIGTNEATRYLAWQPTRTEKPNFHVPAVFGILRFEI